MKGDAVNPYETRPWFVHYAEGVPHEIGEVCN